jgi:myosin heavy subunit
MNELGFTPEEQQKIWKMLISILELGNIQFDDS